jgi:anti-sigma factor RsiW
VRSQLSDQDLTDYALNELAPEERLYVESMLAVSEECRNDVYETIDAAMLIEEGFERQDAKAPSFELTAEQRAKLLDVHLPNRILPRSIAALAAAAAVALAFFSKDAWLPRGTVPQVHQRVSQGFDYVTQAAAEGEDFVSQLQSFRKLTEDPAKWLPTSQPTGGAAAFGPPASMNSEVGSMPPLELTP